MTEPNDNFEKLEFSIDLNKIWHIIIHRKILIALCYVVILSIVALLTLFVLPKMYNSEARILINRASTTNLSEINPFVISELSKGIALGGSYLASSASSLDDDIAVIKSPIVLDDVIKQNNIKYTTGLKTGKYIVSKDFPTENLEIKPAKDSINVITISYKSTDPKYSYNIVNSVLKAYKKAFEIINSKKATDDRQFLETFYNNAMQEFNKKADKLKEY
jgi:uncharacterized protein involved in exopolysaccharide biosynthesis